MGNEFQDGMNTFTFSPVTDHVHDFHRYRCYQQSFDVGSFNPGFSIPGIWVFQSPTTAATRFSILVVELTHTQFGREKRGYGFCQMRLCRLLTQKYLILVVESIQDVSSKTSVFG